jgi:hypothetical protein
MQVISAYGSPSELCTPDVDGNRWALVTHDEHDELQLVCSSGAIGKCIRWGYTPNVSVDVHKACIRMTRADYGGDGSTATRDGTWIGFCDRVGVHPCSGTERIEAAWSADGAVCVAHPRVDQIVTLVELARRYPKLAGHVGPACTLRGTPDAKLFSWIPAQAAGIE